MSLPVPLRHSLKSNNLAHEVGKLHYTLLHLSDPVLIKALKYGLIVGTLTAQDDHENSLMSATTLLNQQGIKFNTIAPYQHKQKLERYVQTINSRFRSVLSSLRFKLPNKLYLLESYNKSMSCLTPYILP